MIKEAKRLNQVQEYYFSQKLQEIRKLKSEGKKILNLGIGNPDLSPSSDTIESLAQSARQPGNHGYQSYRSAPELRQAIALWYERIYGVLLNPEDEILPLIGSKPTATRATWYAAATGVDTAMAANTTPRRIG